MESLLPMAEQLDRAAVELRLDHPIHNRLAVILIDNVVELMLRHALYVHTALGGDLKGITARHRKQARSQSLKERLSVTVFVGELSQVEADVILAAHDHRNAAYHEGTAHQPYLRQLAFHYYRFACDYLARFSRAFDSWSSGFVFTAIGRHYYDKSRNADAIVGTIDRRKLAHLLLAALPTPPVTTLQAALADDLDDKRRGIARGLRFLIENTRPARKAPFLIAKAQFDWARDVALERQGLDNSLYDTPRRVEAVRYVKANLDRFRPKYRAIPHGSWSRSIKRVRETEHPYLALVLFQRTRKSMAFLSEAIAYATMSLEMELDRD